MRPSTNIREPLGALRQWHAELRAGYRGQSLHVPSTWRYDALYRAACAEAHAVEAERDGRDIAARFFVRRACEILQLAARARRVS